MELNKELDNTKKEIFRFEYLQEYFADGSDELENEIDRQFKETGRIDMNLMKEWHDFIAEKIGEGVKMVWVRLVVFPLNDYTKSTLYIYKRRVRYGIDIRIIAKGEFDKFGINAKDFYLLDGERALLMKYGSSNEYLGCELDNDKLEPYKKDRDLLVEHSIPVSEFEY